MSKCFMCGKEINQKNKSIEHIILNAIGGKLKSDKLICKDCNSKMGDEMDIKLAKQLQLFSLLLNVSRDRGETPSLTVTRKKNGEQIKILGGGKPELMYPKVSKIEGNGKRKFEIIGRNHKDVDKIYKDIKKKYPTATMVALREEQEEINEPVNIEYDLGGEGLLSLCKTAICYYLFSGGCQEKIQPLINDFKACKVSERCNFYYPEKTVIEKTENSIFHSIVIIGNPDEKLLFACIELFNFYRVIVMMSDSYNGEKIKNVYCYNLITKRQIDPIVKLNLSSKEIVSYLEKKLEDYGQRLIYELNSTKRLIEMKNMTDKIWDRLFDENKDLYPEGIPHDVFIKQLVEELIHELTPYLRGE